MTIDEMSKLDVDNLRNLNDPEIIVQDNDNLVPIAVLVPFEKWAYAIRTITAMTQMLDEPCVRQMQFFLEKIKQKAESLGQPMATTEYCSQSTTHGSGYLVCTKQAGHMDEHCAHDAMGRVIHSWPNNIPGMMQ